MKVFAAVLAMTVVTELNAQDVEFTTRGDSLIMRAENIASDPFAFRPNELDYLRKLKPKQTVKLVNNDHVEGKTDSVFYLHIDANRFVVYKVDERKSILLEAEINTDRFATRQGIKVGMTKTDVIKQLGYRQVAAVPKFLVLKNMEASTSLTFWFSKEVLTKITFEGFID